MKQKNRSITLKLKKTDELYLSIQEGLAKGIYMFCHHCNGLIEANKTCDICGE